MASFYSPCRCRNFYPKAIVTNIWHERDDNKHPIQRVRYQIACKHCGRHEPKQRKQQ